MVRGYQTNKKNIFFLNKIKMKVEFDLNFMGVVYLLIAIGLIVGVVVSVVDSSSIINTNLSNPLNIVLLTAAILGGLIALGLLVPIVRRMVKAFMPSA